MLPSHRPLVYGILYFVAGFIVILILASLEWPGVVRSCAPIFCFCEPWDETQSFAQPIGFWTNLAYVGVGLFILWQAGRETVGRPADTAGRPNDASLIGVTPYTILYGFISISIGLGSMMLHGSNRTWGGSIDVITMAWFITFAFVYSLSRVLHLPRHCFFWIFGVWNGVIVVLEVTGVYSAYDWFVLLFPVAIAWEFLCLLLHHIQTTRSKPWHIPRRDWRWLLASIGCFTIAFVFWTLWQDGSLVCDPNSWFQGHGMWHILTASALWCTFRYLRSESL